MSEALHVCTCCKAEKPFDAFYARRNRPIGRDSHCKACRIAAQRGNQKALAAIARWREKNKTQEAEKRRVRESRNREHMRALSRAQYARNPARYAKKRIDRRQSVKQATPAWSNTFFVEEAYRLARLRTDATGMKWHVDHIVPLKNDLVCGLHADTNIQVIPATLNHRKSNRLDVAKENEYGC